jgi:hypothetical protein
MGLIFTLHHLKLVPSSSSDSSDSEPDPELESDPGSDPDSKSSDPSSGSDPDSESGPSSGPPSMGPPDLASNSIEPSKDEDHKVGKGCGDGYIVHGNNTG